MAQKPKMPNATAAARGRKRAQPPTIDLTATELPPPPAAAEPPPPPDPPSPPPMEPPPFAGDSPPAFDVPPPAATKTPWFSAATLAAGVAGAVMTALILFALWLTGLVPIRYAGSTAMRARVTGLEMQMHDLQKRPAAALDSKPIAALNERMSKAEAAMAKLPASDAGLADRVAAADNAMKALGVALTALNRRSDDIAANAAKALERAETAEKAATELRATVQQLVADAAKNVSAGIPAAERDALQKRIAALEQSATRAREDIAKTMAETAANSAATDTPARLALSAVALRAAVLSGAPFSAELAQAKSLGADEKTLAALAPFAAGGVPTAQALAQELRALLPGLLKLSGAPAASGSFLERLQANAGRLVRVRPVDAPPGDDASAVLARIEIDASHADIAAALADLGKLPEAARAPAQSWIAQAKNRQAALAAARQFAADAARALGQR